MRYDLGHRAARARSAAFGLHHADQAAGEHPGAAPDVGAAAGQIAALREHVEHPPQPGGIVRVVDEVGGQRELGSLIVAEQLLEHLGEAEPNVAQQRPQLQG